MQQYTYCAKKNNPHHVFGTAYDFVHQDTSGTL